MENVDKQQQDGETEVDLLVLLNLLWNKRKLLLKIISIFILLGLFVAFASKEVYQSQCKLIPEESSLDFNLGGIGGLAGIAGIDIGKFSSSGDIPLDLIPTIYESNDFLTKLWMIEIYFSKEDTLMRTYDYLKNIDQNGLLNEVIKYSIKLPNQVKKLLSNKQEEIINNQRGYLWLNVEDMELLNLFKEHVIINIDAKLNIVYISVNMPDPVAAADLTNATYELLMDYLIEYKIQKAKENLNFINERLKEAESNYLESQRKLAQFTDRNKNLLTASSQIDKQNLENEYNLSFDIYRNLASQVEQTKLQVKEATPVFSIIESPIIPAERSWPKRSLIMLLSLFVGLIIGSLYIIWNYYFYNNLKRRWHQFSSGN